MTQGSARILLVEDDEDFALLVEEKLASEGFSVEWASRGREALGRELRGYACVLTDWNLPDIDTLEMIERLGGGRAAPIVIFSGERSSETVVSALRAGAQDYMLKSMDELAILPHKLRNVIDAFWTRWELEEKREQFSGMIKELEEKNAELEEKNEIIERMAQRDPLTGVYNRRAFREILEKDFGAAERYGHPVSAVMLDVDDFKRVNDAYGHLRGDEVLEELARFLERSVRRVDTVARFGGDEFVILLPHADRSRAEEVVRKLHDDFVRLAADPASPLHGQGVSFGAASYPDSRIANGDELVAKADLALFRAKRTGKNRFETWTSSAP